jgi:hypothetical protein
VLLFDFPNTYIIEDAKEIKEEIDTEFLPIKKQLFRQRIIAVCCFILGVISFSLFVGSNLIRERNNSKKIPLDKEKSIKNVNITVTDSTIIIKPKL